MDSRSGRRKIAKNPSSLPRASLGSERPDDINDANERKLLSRKQKLVLSFRLTD